MIGEVRIYDQALSETEIQSLAQLIERNRLSAMAEK